MAVVVWHGNGFHGTSQ